MVLTVFLQPFGITLVVIPSIIIVFLILFFFLLLPQTLVSLSIYLFMHLSMERMPLMVLTPGINGCSIYK